ncbi:MAG TPA: glucosamine-6-phosphate deaminase [Symbiobacteriaceae bacterium]|nr:glucosamine-6-phosphate deaminase [Symbiobacteriaceae bacterium]
MRVEVYETYAEMSQRAANLVAGLIAEKPGAVLGLPTGSTPEGFYNELAGRDLDFTQVQTFNLDEYIGLDREHPESYYSFMKRHLFSRVNLNPARCHLPNGMAPDPAAECLRYEEAIRQAGGLDVVLLGIGHNGHIGFNEPGAPWDAHTRMVDLAERTIKANARFFGSEEAVPKQALTMGIGTILGARRIVLLASGEGKAEIIRRTLEGDPAVDVPATALQSHPDVTVILDRAAAGALCQVVA